MGKTADLTVKIDKINFIVPKEICAGHIQYIICCSTQITYCIHMTQRPLSALPTLYSEQLNYALPFVQHPFNHHVYIYLHTPDGENIYIHTHVYIYIYTHYNC